MIRMSWQRSQGTSRSNRKDRQGAPQLARPRRRRAARLSILAWGVLMVSLALPPMAAAGPGGDGATATTAGSGWSLQGLALPAWLDAFLGSLGVDRVSAAAGGGITVGGVAADGDVEHSRQAELRTRPPAAEPSTEGSGNPKP